jgi:tight adherence protein C
MTKPLTKLKAARTIGGSRFSSVSFKAVLNQDDPYLCEVPQHLDVIAARLQNGESFYGVLAGNSAASGDFAVALNRLGTRITYGESVEVGLQLLATECASQLVTEFTNKTILSLKRGTKLADQIALLADSARAQLKIQQLKAAGKNELKMLIPLVFMILPVTIAFAIFPSLQLLQVGF